MPFLAASVDLSDDPSGGTLMRWGDRHWSEEDKAKPAAMGFEAGWNAAAEQLDELARRTAAA